MINRTLAQADPEMARVMAGEMKRQQTTLMLIPSENYASRAVMAATGSIFTNKYAEGYPGRRYYNGCQYYDELETLAIERAKKLFGADHANVQPHTGSQANMSAFYALLEPGDRILSMSVAQGGHLTHGSPVNFSGQYYQPHFYGVSEDTGRLDYDEILQIARKVRPKLIIAGASAYPRIIDFQKFREIADDVGAYLLADIAHIVGLVAAEAHPDPVPYCDVVTSTTHKTLRGPRGAFILCREEWADRIDRAVFPGIQAGPLMQIIAAKAVVFREAQEFGFREYQRQIIHNCQAMAQSLLEEGFELVTGGTDNHLMLVDLRNKNITGREAADLMEAAGMIVNKNLIPGDPRSPRETSGIRPGTPGITTRGMKEEEARLIGKLIARVIHDGRGSESVIEEVRKQVLELCEAFPIYADLEL
ncbi:MAG: serine hydroxymethyltransferase [Armatimonadetes bacterium]|nr:serine hydroxymethyltransferase [Armatimonadota bacterium]